MKKISISIIFITISTINFAQTSYEYGILPSLNLRKNFPANWTALFKIESRQSLFNQELQYNYLLTDISLVTTKRITPNISVGGGYLLRVDGDDFYNRTIQQISYSKKYTDFRIGHRILTDQTFGNNEPTEYRVRYRISAEIPLQGQSIDVNEFYLKTSNEYLNSWENREYDLEIRLLGLIGYTLSSKNDLEIGIDYRANSFIDGSPRNRFWLSMNFFHLLGKD